MNRPTPRLAALCAAVLVAGLGNTCDEATAPPAPQEPVATLRAVGAELVWKPVIECDGLRLTVTGGDDFAAQESFPAGIAPRFVLEDDEGARLPDGLYRYELRARLLLDESTQGALDAVVDDPAARGLLHESGLVPRGPVQAGHFRVRDGAAVLPDPLAEESS